MTDQEFFERMQQTKSQQEIRQLCVEAGVQSGALTQDWTGAIQPNESKMAEHQAVAQRERAAVAIADAKARVEAAERAVYAERENAKRVYAAAEAVGQPAPVQPAPTKPMHEVKVMIYDNEVGYELPGVLRFEHEEDMPQLLKKHNARLRLPSEIHS